MPHNGAFFEKGHIMKIFNRMTRQQFIDGRLIPTNAFYGRLVLKYTDKIKVGNRPVFDKNGYPIFRQDGTQVTRNVYKRVEKACEVTYSVEDLFPVSIGDTTCFKAWYKIGRDSRWRNESVLNHNALEVELNNFIVRKVQDYCAQNNCGLFDLCMAVKRPHLNRTRQCAQSAAGRREVQTTFVYSGGEGQILRARHAINENVRFNADGSSVKGVIATHKGAFNGMHGEEPARYDKPFVKADYKMAGKKPTFTKFVETPSGILRFYNEREYNEYMSAQK